MPMRQLRSCDFCGADAAGVYEVLPPELSPTEAEQRRIVLCADCAGTLETVIDPLLERLGAETGSAPAGDADDDSAGRSVAAEVSTADERGPDRPDQSSTADPEPGDDHDDGVVQWGESGPAGEDVSSDPERPQSDPVRNGVPGVDPSDGDPAETGIPDGTVAGDVDDAGSDDHDADGAVGDGIDAADTADATGDDDPTPSAEPEEFRTVMRLLGNREFPVERGAIVELAASAYELDEEHVHRIIDHAVDRGVIADDGGTLRRN